MGKSESGKKRCKFKDAALYSSTMGEDICNFSYDSELNIPIPIQDCDLSTEKIGEQLQEIGPPIDFDLSHRKHSSLLKCISSGTLEGNKFNWESGVKFQSSSNNFIQAARESFGSKSVVQRGASNNFGSHVLHSTWEDEFKNVNSFVSDEIKERTLFSESADFSNDLQIGSERKKTFLQGCSSRDKLSLSWGSFARKGDIVPFGCDGDEGFEYQIGSRKMKRKQTCLDNDIHSDEVRSDGYLIWI